MNIRNRELNRQYQIIKNLIDSTADFTNHNIELQGHWGKYICVLVAGFIENAIREVYTEFVENSSSSEQVRSFANKRLNRISNPNGQRFIETAYSFSTEWGDGLKQHFATKPEQKSAIDSIMKHRHQIAHGKSARIGISGVKDYLEKIIVAIAFIENQCSAQRF